MPEVGGTYLGFRLVEELGRGAFARVYLAEQEALAGRRVALKVTLRPTNEPERLARLQHPNVVPVYSVHPAATAQVICMPFRGRRTLADLLRRHRPSGVGSGRRTASGTRKIGSTTQADDRHAARQTSAPASERVRHPEPIEDDRADVVGNPLEVLRLVGQIADGLAHAHARGILHLDLKPANVLLADTGEAMLLDFNLSYDTLTGDRGLVGGTVPYMAPEQLLDLRSHGRGSVDARTDLYALGVLAFELLTGAVPFPAGSRRLQDFDALIAARNAGPPRPSLVNPVVGPGAEAVVMKLLAPDPARRYQTAADLREDIDSHLSDHPLRHAPNRSVRERLGKWFRRHPKAGTRAAVALLLGLAAGLLIHARNESTGRADAVAAARARDTRAALEAIRLDLALPNHPADRQRGRARACEMLAGYGLPDDPTWPLRPEYARLPPDERVALAGDLGELLLLVAHADWHDALVKGGGDRMAAAANGLRLTRAAGWCFVDGPAPPPLAHLIRLFNAELSGTPLTPVTDETPSDARGRFLGAVDLIARGQYVAAIPLLEAVVGTRPDHGTAQFCLAYARHQLGQYARALERYDAARALLPSDPRPPYYRGMAFVFLKKYDAAEAEFSRSIDLDPGRAGVHRDRAQVRVRLGHLREAEADLARALELGGPELQLRLMRAKVRRLLADTAGADEDMAAASLVRPVHEVDHLMRGANLVQVDPAAALDAFRAAEAVNPRSFPALQNQAHVLALKSDGNEQALELSSRAVSLYPELATARAGKAVLLARLGRRDEAHREAEHVRRLSDDPTATYQCGCVYALTAATHPEDKSTALALLRQAFRDGYGNAAGLLTDRDLDALRSTTEFRSFVAAITVLYRDQTAAP